MITVDGIEITGVVSIECNHDTNFLVVIQFHDDTRIEKCIDTEKVKKYGLIKIQEQQEGQLGISQITVNADKINIES